MTEGQNLTASNSSASGEFEDNGDPSAPSALPSIVAIRNSSRLKGPAIFICWEEDDRNNVIEQFIGAYEADNDGRAIDGFDYQTFEALGEAFFYVEDHLKSAQPRHASKLTDVASTDDADPIIDDESIEEEEIIEDDESYIEELVESDDDGEEGENVLPGSQNVVKRRSWVGHSSSPDGTGRIDDKLVGIGEVDCTPACTETPRAETSEVNITIEQRSKLEVVKGESTDRLDDTTSTPDTSNSLDDTSSSRIQSMHETAISTGTEHNEVVAGAMIETSHSSCLDNVGTTRKDTQQQKSPPPEPSTESDCIENNSETKEEEEIKLALVPDASSENDKLSGSATRTDDGQQCFSEQENGDTKTTDDASMAEIDSKYHEAPNENPSGGDSNSASEQVAATLTLGQKSPKSSENNKTDTEVPDDATIEEEVVVLDGETYLEEVVDLDDDFESSRVSRIDVDVDPDVVREGGDNPPDDKSFVEEVVETDDEMDKIQGDEAVSVMAVSHVPGETTEHETCQHGESEYHPSNDATVTNDDVDLNLDNMSQDFIAMDNAPKQTSSDEGATGSAGERPSNTRQIVEGRDPFKDVLATDGNMRSTEGEQDREDVVALDQLAVEEKDGDVSTLKSEEEARPTTNESLEQPPESPIIHMPIEHEARDSFMVGEDRNNLAGDSLVTNGERLNDETTGNQKVINTVEDADTMTDEASFVTTEEGTVKQKYEEDVAFDILISEKVAAVVVELNTEPEAKLTEEVVDEVSLKSELKETKVIEGETEKKLEDKKAGENANLITEMEAKQIQEEDAVKEAEIKAETEAEIFADAEIPLEVDAKKVEGKAAGNVTELKDESEVNIMAEEEAMNGDRLEEAFEGVRIVVEDIAKEEMLEADLETNCIGEEEPADGAEENAELAKQLQEENAAEEPIKAGLEPNALAKVEKNTKNVKSKVEDNDFGERSTDHPKASTASPSTAPSSLSRAHGSRFSPRQSQGTLSPKTINASPKASKTSPGGNESPFQSSPRRISRLSVASDEPSEFLAVFKAISPSASNKPVIKKNYGQLGPDKTVEEASPHKVVVASSSGKSIARSPLRKSQIPGKLGAIKPPSLEASSDATTPNLISSRRPTSRQTTELFNSSKAPGLKTKLSSSVASSGPTKLPDEPSFVSPKLPESANQHYSLEDLQKQKIEGLDYTCRENYLSPIDFELHFKMTKEQFLEMPKWKRERAKRKLRLF